MILEKKTVTQNIPDFLGKIKPTTEAQKNFSQILKNYLNTMPDFLVVNPFENNEPAFHLVNIEQINVEAVRTWSHTFKPTNMDEEKFLSNLCDCLKKNVEQWTDEEWRVVCLGHMFSVENVSTNILLAYDGTI